jgi:hypothetical protein
VTTPTAGGASASKANVEPRCVVYKNARLRAAIFQTTANAKDIESLSVQTDAWAGSILRAFEHNHPVSATSIFERQRPLTARSSSFVCARHLRP